MALASTMVWQVRSTGGSTAYGAGFNPANPAAGINYSLQAPIFTPTDLAMVNGSTTLTSTGGGFTPAMVGNLIYIADFALPSWTYRYEIVTYIDTHTVTLNATATSGSDESDGRGWVGGATSSIQSAASRAVAGNVIHVASGAYTLTSGSGSYGPVSLPAGVTVDAEAGSTLSAGGFSGITLITGNGSDGNSAIVRGLEVDGNGGAGNVGFSGVVGETYGLRLEECAMVECQAAAARYVEAN